MGEQTGISWTDATWNCVTGCTKISDGCKHCYAETLSARFGATMGSWGPNGTRKITSESGWKNPGKWARKHLRAVQAGAPQRPLRIFTLSLGDLFEDHPVVESVRRRVWDETLPELDGLRFPDGSPVAVLLSLSKRTEIQAAWAKENGWPDTVWAGASVENQKAADERIPHLLTIPARVRFLSMEPLLGPVDLRNGTRNRWSVPTARDAQGHGIEWTDPGPEYIPVSWVIVGGESGAKARPMHPAWARSLRDQCVAAGVAFHFKQWGEWAPYRRDLMEVGSPIATRAGNAPASITVSDPVAGSLSMLRAGKHAAGRLLDGRTWDEVPQ